MCTITLRQNAFYFFNWIENYVEIGFELIDVFVCMGFFLEVYHTDKDTALIIRYD